MKDIRKIMLNKKAQGFERVAVSIVVVVIVLLVGLLLYSKFSATIDQDGFTAAENATIESIRTNALAGFDLTSIGPIVLAGVGILAAVSLFNR